MKIAEYLAFLFLLLFWLPYYFVSGNEQKDYNECLREDEEAFRDMTYFEETCVLN